MGKKLLKTNLVLLCLTLILVSCGAQESSGSFVSGASSSGTRWNASVFPIDLRIADTFISSEVTAADDMAAEWSTAVENQITFFNSLSTTPNLEYTDGNDYNDGVQAIYQLNTWPLEFPTTALAVTQIFAIVSGGGYLITHADILMNDEFYDFSTDPNDFSNYDYNTVVLHEIGHFLGLGHQSFSVESVMQPSVSKIDANRETSDADRGNLAANYGLTTSFSQFSSLNTSEQVSLTAGMSGASKSGNVRMVIQLMADGECQHVLEGEIVHSHQVELGR